SVIGRAARRRGGRARRRVIVVVGRFAAARLLTAAATAALVIVVGRIGSRLVGHPRGVFALRCGALGASSKQHRAHQREPPYVVSMTHHQHGNVFRRTETTTPPAASKTLVSKARPSSARGEVPRSCG